MIHICLVMLSTLSCGYLIARLEQTRHHFYSAPLYYSYTVYPDNNRLPANLVIPLHEARLYYLNLDHMSCSFMVLVI